MESALWNQASSLFGALQELRISAVAASRPGGKAGTACLDLRRHSMRLCFPITSGRLKGPGIHPVISLSRWTRVKGFSFSLARLPTCLRNGPIHHSNIRREQHRCGIATVTRSH
jgi:hypothetical protein